MARYFLTTAIDYVNNRPHLGTAYEKIAADVIARYHRLRGDDVRFVMGNDEHSQNVFRRARELGLEPLAYCDRMEQEFRDVWRRLNISFDDFIRTSESRHKQAVERLVRESFDHGDIYEGVYEGYYCVSCEEFKPEKTLVDGRCPIHRTTPEWIREKNFFFRLSKYGGALLDHYDAHPDFVVPASRQNEMRRLIEGGLEDISVSRAGQSWGIPLPFDPTSVVYVWYDALINYISAVGYGADRATFDEWWPADLHVIGKDITRFHCVVWPAMLLSAGVELPKQVFGHGWVLFKGEKMSKSLGTIVDPLEAADRLGPDPLRWYLTREITFGQDGDFSWDLFDKSYNADLANNLGNLVNRVSSMAHRYRSGLLRAPGATPEALGAFRDAGVERYRAAMDRHDLAEGASVAMSFIDQANEHIAREEPWRLAKAGSERALDAVLWNASEALRIGSVLLSPFMPASCAEILRRLGGPASETGPTVHDAAWQVHGSRTLEQGSLLWPRLEAREVAPAVTTAPPSLKETPVTDEPSPTAANTPAPPQNEAAASPPTQWPLDQRITIDEFLKIDLRVARVLKAERVPNSKKLIRLEVDLGSETRTLVAGIAEAYEADALVGRLVTIVANLKPAKLMGVESNGMVLAASPENGRPMLVAFDEPPPPGEPRAVVVVDSHCHLADEAFVGDLEAVVARAISAGVTHALCILAADEPEEMARAVTVKSAWPAARFSTAVHPHGAGAYARRPEAAAALARAAVQSVDAVVVGEIGLDYHYDFAPKDVQREVFAAQVDLAVDLGRPVAIHTREASDDTFAVIREAGRGRVRGVMHCFSHGETELRRALDLDFFISIAGILTFPKAQALRDVAALVPLDRLLVETDAPFLAPVPHRGHRNEPAWVVETLRCLASLRGLPTDTLGAQVAANFATLIDAP